MSKIITRAGAVPFSVLLAIAVFAQTAPRDPEKETAIWKELQTVASKSLGQFKAATESLDRAEFDKAAQQFEAVLQQAPNFEVALRRGGAALALSGRREDGIALLERAYGISQSPENAISIARVLADTSGENDRKSLERALVMARFALPMAPAGDPSYLVLYTTLALQTDNEPAFREGLKWLQRQYPNEMPAHFFEAVRAAKDGDEETARREIEIAERMGLPAGVARKFSASPEGIPDKFWQYMRYALYLILGWATGLLTLFILGKVFSNRMLRSIEQTNPNGKASNSEVSLRIWYRRLINAAGVYYYLSLPVVAAILIAVVCLIFYFFLWIGRIPIQATLLLIICLLVTLWMMIRSLFVRIKSEDPGRALKPEEAPSLWALTREVARLVGTRPVDEIRITPGCELAVYEKGSRRQRAANKSKRHLILGVGVLNGLRINAFRAILAHEYGHFSNRDTAGGDVALRVNQDMVKFVVALAQSGQNLRFSIPFNFVRLYHFLYRRITHGATRLQEVLADRVAVRIFGAAAFEEGLRHVIRRGVVFDLSTTKEIQAAMQTERALANLYQLPGPNNYDEAKQIEEQIEQIVNHATTEDDTHPSPIERFRLANRIECKNLMPPAGLVWDLFANREALTEEMSRVIDQQARASKT